MLAKTKNFTDMQYYIGNTDFEWFRFLSLIKPEDVNFWQPGGKSNFKAVLPGAPFLFKLKMPYNKIVGVGFFSSHSILPINFAWEVFKERNGVSSYIEFAKKIKNYRGESNTIEENPNIGCIVLTNPVFFNERDWINVPDNWASNIVQGKTYGLNDEAGLKLWKMVQENLSKYSDSPVVENIGEEQPKYGHGVTKIRIGQGAFRVLVTDAYSRRCAISGEKTLPVLEAAHIKPYSISGVNLTKNGLLLRADMHKLFDSGYITITNGYVIEISRKIKEEFENGREYYKFHGQTLVSLPKNILDMPDKENLVWHNENVFRV
jgi:putative restriction endonuclease